MDVSLPVSTMTTEPQQLQPYLSPPSPLSVLDNAPKPMTNYNEHSKCQKTTNLRPNRLLEKSAKYVSKQFPNELNIADFGCSHGLNSMECIKAALNGYKTITNSQLSILIYLNDLPDNDFGEVLKCLADPTISFESHPTLESATHSTLLSGKSFYKQCFPKNHLNLAFSFNSLHWIDNPITLENAICFKTSQVTPKERIIGEEIAHNNLVQFLKHRQVEMKVGGRLVLTILREIVTIEKFDQLWKLYLELNGLEVSAFPNLVVPVYPRSSRELYKSLRSVPKFKRIHHDHEIVGSASFCIQTVKAATYNVMLHGMESNSHLLPIDATTFINNFYEFMVPHWNDTKPIFHLVVLERV